MISYEDRMDLINESQYLFFQECSLDASMHMVINEGAIVDAIKKAIDSIIDFFKKVIKTIKEFLFGKDKTSDELCKSCDEYIRKIESNKNNKSAKISYYKLSDAGKSSLEYIKSANSDLFRQYNTIRLKGAQFSRYKTGLNDNDINQSDDIDSKLQGLNEKDKLFVNVKVEYDGNVGTIKKDYDDIKSAYQVCKTEAKSLNNLSEDYIKLGETWKGVLSDKDVTESTTKNIKILLKIINIEQTRVGELLKGVTTMSNYINTSLNIFEKEFKRLSK